MSRIEHLTRLEKARPKRIRTLIIGGQPPPDLQPGEKLPPGLKFVVLPAKDESPHITESKAMITLFNLRGMRRLAADVLIRALRDAAGPIEAELWVLRSEQSTIFRETLDLGNLDVSQVVERVKAGEVVEAKV